MTAAPSTLRINQLVELLLTEDDKRNEVTRRQASFLRYSLLTTLLLSVMYALSLYAIDYPIGVWVLVGYVMLHLFFLFLLWKKVRTAVVGNAFCVMTVVGFVILSTTSNGTSSATIVWFFATIVSGFWFVGRRAGYYWGAASVLVVVCLFASEAMGMRYPLAFPAKYYYIYAGIAHTGALLYAVVVVITYENWQLSAVQRAEEQRQELFAQKQESEAQRDTLEQVLIKLNTTQHQLIQNAKMASLGELTAGIAHEIQNPLNFVNNFSEVSIELIVELQERIAPILIESERDYAEEILRDLSQNLEKINYHGSRASNIVKGMLAHSRSGPSELRPTNLNVLADECLRIAYRGQQAKDKAFTCNLLTDFGPDLGQVNLISQEITQVLLNLFTNAFYAVCHSPKRGFATYQPTVHVQTHRLTDWIEIRVKDNGTGIPASVQQKIFQPFFTTKPTGEGTGLGLSLAYESITKGHGGQLAVESQEGEGTEFIIDLPILEII